MNVLITGGTGFIGKQLIQLLLKEGHSVTNLSTQRNQERVISEHFQHVYWNPTTKEINKNLLPEIQGVIHLAGFSVANKWTAANKALMVSSRISSTEFLCELLNEMNS
ncbi:MAG: NAD-dependent epimerase/dehydratase family protein, partial [Flavobacteriales bacterium]|nr:NAD-dependent epimerase/dehydratase family protein [Flavobacteriales bacterium]MDP4951121.1 NAD-dependent epimerase/dehydratase family protein [Flavobacteriales bacterium]